MNTNQQFLSSIKRTDQWTYQMDAPYSRPQTLNNPGPWKYNLEKKKDDMKTKILMEETVKVPFNSSDERDCNKSAIASAAPGPGAYIDINNPHHSSVCKPLLKFQSDRSFAEAHGIKIGGFGSNTKRFIHQKHSLVPGPGYYSTADARSTSMAADGN